MLQVLRLTTVHPALVHVTVGVVPLVALAYAIAAVRRSPRWTFAADAMLVLAAAVTIAVVAFGVVAYVLVPWPGGLETWRALHVVFGASAAAVVLGLAVVRAHRRRRVETSGAWTAAVAGLATLLVLFAGWVGGEVLVFHSGVAVAAAGGGALAPPLGHPRHPPRDLRDAMNRVRATWGDVNARMSGMIVRTPRADELDAVADDAERLQTLAAWIAENGPSTLPRPNDPLTRPGAGARGPDERPDGVVPIAAATPADDADENEATPTRGERLRVIALAFGMLAARVERSARLHDMRGAAAHAALLEVVCTECHSELRW